MQYGIQPQLEILPNSNLLIGLFSNHPLPNAFESLDGQSLQLIERQRSYLKEEGDHIWVTLPETNILLIDLGEESSYSLQKLKKRLAQITATILKQRVISASLYLPQLPMLSPDMQLQHMATQISDQCYQFQTLKSVKKPHNLEKLTFIGTSFNEKALKKALALTEGMQLTKDLANLPANICTPTYLAEQAKELAKSYSTITTKILEKNELEALGMGLFLSVARGSHEPPKFIEIHYHGASHKTPVVLIGKGITFDSGGISLKPAAGMEEMKFDMAGAASVLGTLKACALLNLPINVIGLIPTTENMPGGSATKPGDVITSMSKQTVEITNTDAEGRLILADALTYAEQFNPAWVIDIATLTGAVIVALGHEASGLLTPHDEFATLILNAAQKADDFTWRLPMNEIYNEALESPVADMSNATADRSAGTIAGACFLNRYANKFKWAHLDIAGTAWQSGKNRAATGRPVPLLLQILNDVSTN